MNKIGSWSKEKIKNLDLFSRSISLTYKGKDTFQTLYGGVISLGIILLCLFYLTRLTIIMFSRADTSNSKNSIQKDILSNEDVYEISKDDFSFVVLLENSDTGKTFFDKSYITTSVTQYEVSIEDDGVEKTK